MELCEWGRRRIDTYSFSNSLPASVTPDIESVGCILNWGYNTAVHACDRYPPPDQGMASYIGMTSYDRADLVGGSIPMCAYVYQISRLVRLECFTE